MHDHSTSRLSTIRLRKLRLVKKAGSFFLIFVLSAFALVYVWERVQVISEGYEIEKLKKDKDALVKENKGLQIEAATLTSPDRIEAIAGKNIGMKQAGSEQLILVKRVGKGRGPTADRTRHADRPATSPGKS
jgi:cell division protein FtsL